MVCKVRNGPTAPLENGTNFLSRVQLQRLLNVYILGHPIWPGVGGSMFLPMGQI